MFRMPSLGLAEVSWRWSFGAASSLLAGFCVFEYLDTLPVSPADLFLLSTRQPALIAQALAHVFHGSAGRLANATVLLSLGLSIVWIAASAVGRAATLKSLVLYFRQLGFMEQAEGAPLARMATLFGLGFLRATVAVAAAVGTAGALVLGGAVSPAADPSPGLAFLVFLTVLMFVGCAWGTVNWSLSLASVFAVSGRYDTFGAIGAAVDLCRSRMRAIAAASFWFGLAHGVAFFVMSSIIAFPLAFIAILPAGVVLGGVLLFALLYFLVVDFLYAGRLAAYLCIAEGMGLTVESEDLPALSDGNARERVDPDELILSDLPSLS